MTKNVRLAPLADHIVSRTPARSYQNRDHLWMVLVKRNASQLRGSPTAIEILTDMVERRLIERDGAAYS
jgi:hypothetical protein